MNTFLKFSRGIMNCCAWSSILSFSSSIADIRRPNSFKELKNILNWLSDAFPYYVIEYDTVNIFTRVNKKYWAYPAIIISSSVCWFPMHSNLKLSRVFDNLRWAEDKAVKINMTFKCCWHRTLPLLNVLVWQLPLKHYIVL